MRLLLAAFALVAFAASTCNAAFIVSSQTVASGPNTLRFGVYQSTGAGDSTIGISLNANEYAYLYQVAAPAGSVATTSLSHPFNSNTVGFIASPNAFLTGASFVAGNTPTVLASGTPTSASFVSSTPGFAFSGTTQVLFIRTLAAPIAGTVNFSSGANLGSFAAAVPVPVPAAFGLALAGIPFVGFMRRRMARKQA